MLISDNIGTVSVDDCNSRETANKDPFLDCNAPGPGMARVFNSNNAYASLTVSSPLKSDAVLTVARHTMDTTNPMDASSDYNVGIASTVTIDVSLAAAGSVASWLACNFNYNFSQEFPDLSNGLLTSDDVTKAQGLQITQDAASTCRSVRFRI